MQLRTLVGQYRRIDQEANISQRQGIWALFGRIKTFYQRHVKAFSALLTTVVLIVWLLGPVFADVLSLAQSIAISLAIVLVMLGLVQEFLNDLVDVRKLGICSSQSESNRAVMQTLVNKKIEEVRMIEYDAESTKPLIFFFLEKGATVHCLLQHPDYTVNESQRRRLILQIMTKNEEYPGCQDRIRFSYYRDTASVRGRLIDDELLCLGWYSYDRREGLLGRQIWGHTNPVLSTEPKSAEGQVLTQFFTTVFDNLLDHSNTWDELASTYELVIRNRQVPERNERVRFDLDMTRHTVEQQAVPADISFQCFDDSTMGELPRAEILALLSLSFDDRSWDEAKLSQSVLSASFLAAVTAHSQDDQLAGFVSLHATDDPGVGKVHWLAVADRWRGQGIGRALMVEVWQLARQAGFSQLTLHTEQYRTAALTLYRRLGFEETLEDPEPVG